MQMDVTCKSVGAAVTSMAARKSGRERHEDVEKAQRSVTWATVTRAASEEAPSDRPGPEKRKLKTLRTAPPRVLQGQMLTGALP